MCLLGNFRDVAVTNREKYGGNSGLGAAEY
jgi:hypothetical protein